MASRNMETCLKLVADADFENDLTSERSKAAMAAAYAPEFEIVQPLSLPQGGVHTGRDGWLKMLEIMKARWQQKVWHERIWDLPEDDLIILYSWLTWTARANGEEIRFPSVELLWFEDGLISKVEMFISDTKRILDVLGEE
jgi:hypothetical protein